MTWTYRLLLVLLKRSDLFLLSAIFIVHARSHLPHPGMAYCRISHDRVEKTSTFYSRYKNSLLLYIFLEETNHISCICFQKLYRNTGFLTSIVFTGKENWTSKWKDALSIRFQTCPFRDYFQNRFSSTDGACNFLRFVKTRTRRLGQLCWKYCL